MPFRLLSYFSLVPVFSSFIYLSLYLLTRNIDNIMPPHTHTHTYKHSKDLRRVRGPVQTWQDMSALTLNMPVDSY